MALLTGLLPILLLVGFWIFLMNQMQGGGSKVMSFGKSRAKRMSPDSPKVTYKDVAGADEAVEELQEIKEFLENPKKFQALGARIPKGVLLYGPPGTGKTLLARATAGEAGVPFFSISGSDFVEMFVGVGASRVRDLFEQAKQASPCIIFIDEIDAVGRHRGAGMGGGHDEREQTLNQLLVEMDGFEQKDNVILIAATNRPDILDPALLRPGRFDRQIVVDRPDRKGRRDILEVHSKGKPLGKELDLDVLAAQTPGFTGADLANVINESALLAARRGEKTIGQNELEEGIMRVIAGPEKKSRLFSEKERKITAYHEMGHALVGYYLEGTDDVHKISIVSRGQALGYTISLPSEDRYLTTKGTLMVDDGDDARRPRGRGARLPRGHDRRRERPREGHAHREADDHALRDEREARPARARPRPRHAVPRPRHGLGARLLRGDRPRDRRRDPPRDRGGARHGDPRPARAHGRAPQPLADPDRARDGRQGSVRAPARRRGRGHGLPGGGRSPSRRPRPRRRPRRSPRCGRRRGRSRARRCSRRPRAQPADPGCRLARSDAQPGRARRAAGASRAAQHEQADGAGCGRDADDLDREAAGAEHVDDGEERRAEAERDQREHGDPADPSRQRAGLVRHGRAGLEREVRELADREQRRPDDRRAGVERGVVDHEDQRRRRRRGARARPRCGSGLPTASVDARGRRRPTAPMPATGRAASGPAASASQAGEPSRERDRARPEG